MYRTHSRAQFGYVFTLKISSPLNQYSIYHKITRLKLSTERLARPSCRSPHSSFLVRSYCLSLYSGYFVLLSSAVVPLILFVFFLFCNAFLFTLSQTIIASSSYFLLLFNFTSLAFRNFNLYLLYLIKISPHSTSYCHPVMFSSSLLCTCLLSLLLFFITFVPF